MKKVKIKVDRKTCHGFLFLALAVAAGGILAGDERGIEEEPATQEQRQKRENYWTPERMEKATPMPLEAEPKKPKSEDSQRPEKKPSEGSPDEPNR